MNNNLPQIISSHQAYKISSSNEYILVDTRNNKSIYNSGSPKGSFRCEYDKDLKVFLSKITEFNTENKKMVFFFDNFEHENNQMDPFDSLVSFFPDKSQNYYRVADGVEGNDSGNGWIANGYPMEFLEIDLSN
tara:strand:+ start:406 stop:804 length:399 start_codon:yes stop_codon:yes gene_type:complete